MDEGFNKQGKDEDFMEEDVMWGTNMNFMKERESSTASNNKSNKRVPRVIPRVNTHHHHHHQSSAPVNIPEYSWSKNKSRRGLISNNAWATPDGNNAEDDDDGDGDEMVPPHEFIARRFARSPVVSFSMCEGVGRTLKGRDLSKLRNAILTKTGFLE